MTAAQIRRMLIAAEARAALALKEVELFRELLRLHSEAERSNIDSNMQANVDGKSRATRISAGRAVKSTPSRTAAIAADLSDMGIADLVGASRQAVQKWHAGKLAIPRRHAEKLAKVRSVAGVEKPGIPVSSWPRVQN